VNCARSEAILEGYRSMPSSKTPVAFDSSKIDAIFSALDQNLLPGAAVGIAVGGEPVYRRGFGLANMELPIPLSPQIRMRIASTSKQFAALAFMLLCEDGKANLDDIISTYVPELHPVSRSATMRQLMNHTAGLRDSFDLCHLFGGTGHRVTSGELLAFYEDISDVNAPAGETWNYNNGAYVLLSAAIERVSDQSLEDVLWKRVFAPIGMNDTLLRRFDTNFVANSASPHMGNPERGYEKSFIGSAGDGCGGIVSTVDDLLLWLRHMDAPWIGSGPTWQVMRSPHILANGCSTGYGLGLMNHRYRGIWRVGHAGNLMGSSAQLLKVPSAGLDVTVLVNRHDMSAALLADKILEACLPTLEPQAATFAGPFASGVFRSRTTGRVICLEASTSGYVEDDQPVQIATINGASYPLEAAGDKVFRPTGIVGYMNMTFALSGNCEAPDSVQFDDFGNTDELTRVDQIDGDDGRTILGNYVSDTNGTTAWIETGQSGVQMTTVGRFGSVRFALEPLAKNIWAAQSSDPLPWSGVLSFSDGKQDFTFSSLRSPNILFRRVA
jgi:D-aminopeptidase